VCIGEGLDIRKEGGQVGFTLGELEAGLAGLDIDQVRKVVIAYEPVWAIGTGEVATPDDAQEVCGAIRIRLAEMYGEELAQEVRVLYGGSMKTGNVAGLMSMPDIDGGLVGGASLDANEFVTLIRYRLHAGV
jgi:triosephosphate isomerase